MEKITNASHRHFQKISRSQNPINKIYSIEATPEPRTKIKKKINLISPRPERKRKHRDKKAPRSTHPESLKIPRRKARQNIKLYLLTAIAQNR